MKLLKKQDILKIKKLSIKINKLLVNYFKKINFILVDYKMEFGVYKKDIILADEISPDCCRLWDKKSKLSFDKDIFREAKGNLIESYKEVLKRIEMKSNLSLFEID